MGVEMPHFSHLLSLAGPTSAPLLSAHNGLRLPFKCICFECLTQKKFCWSRNGSFDKTQTRCHYVYVILNVLFNAFKCCFTILVDKGYDLSSSEKTVFMTKNFVS